MKLEDVILIDTRANQPAASAVPVGTLFCVTDESDIVERSNGATWDAYSPAGGGSVTNTGTLTANALILGNGSADVTAAASLGTTTTVLHGNAAGAPSFGAVSLSADVSGTLPTSNMATASRVRVLLFVISNGVTALQPGQFVDLRIPQNLTGTITRVSVLAAQSGSLVLDIFKAAYASYPPASSICASALPTLSAADKYEDATLSGWTTGVTAGDCYRGQVVSATTITQATMELEVTI